MNFLPRVTIFILVVPKPFVLLLLLPPNTANIRTSSNESWQESENDFFFIPTSIPCKRNGLFVIRTKIPLKLLKGYKHSLSLAFEILFTSGPL
jgi:hypothetical protein